MLCNRPWLRTFGLRRRACRVVICLDIIASATLLAWWRNRTAASGCAASINASVASVGGEAARPAGAARQNEAGRHNLETDRVGQRFDDDAKTCRPQYEFSCVAVGRHALSGTALRPDEKCRPGVRVSHSYDIARLFGFEGEAAVRERRDDGLRFRDPVQSGDPPSLWRPGQGNRYAVRHRKSQQRAARKELHARLAKYRVKMQRGHVDRPSFIEDDECSAAALENRGPGGIAERYDEGRTVEAFRQPRVPREQADRPHALGQEIPPRRGWRRRRWRTIMGNIGGRTGEAGSSCAVSAP